MLQQKIEIRKIIYWIIFAFLFSNQQAFSAGMPKDQTCNSFVGRLDYHKKLSDDFFSNIEKKAERIPPDVRDYLSKEWYEAVSTNNNVKGNNVISNKFYYPWRFYENLKNFKENTLIKLEKYDEVIFYVSSLNKLNDTIDAFKEYFEFDSQRLPKIFESDDRFRILYRKGVFVLAIDEMIKCAIEYP